MIIIVSGTSGSGKTHLVRRIMDRLPKPPDGDRMLVRSEKKKTVKVASFWGPPHNITIFGKYDGPTCGGCDCYSWKGAGDDLEALIIREVETGQRVLLEGLMVAAWGIDRLTRLFKYGVVVVHLNTPLDQCLNAVNERRRTRAVATGKEYTPVNPENTSSKYRSLKKQDTRRRAHGIPVVDLDREDAYEYVTKALFVQGVT